MIFSKNVSKKYDFDYFIKNNFYFLKYFDYF